MKSNFLLAGSFLALLVAGASMNVFWSSEASAFDATSTSFFVRQSILPIAVTSKALTAAPTSGLIGHWTFNENAGTIAYNKAGSTANGTLTGSPTWIPGKLDSALDFNGTTAYVSLGTQALGYSSITVSLWMRYTSNTCPVSGAHIGYEGLISKNTFNDFVLGYNCSGIDNGKAVFYAVNTSAVPSGNVFSNTLVNDDAWHMLTVICDGANCGMYTDGVFQNQIALAGSVNDASALMTIGTYSDLVSYFSGSIDDVRIYNRALSPGEITQLYTATSLGNVTHSFATSTSFKLVGAGGEFGVGTSTSSTFGLMGGFIRNLYKGPAPSYTQIHYHWRNDDGSEAAATSKTSGVADTSISSLAKSTGVRLRLEVSNEGGTKTAYAQQQFRLEYGLKSTTCAAISSWTDVGAVAGDWDMFNSSNLTEGGNTTNIALAVGGVANENATFIASNGGIRDTTSQTSSVAVSSDSYIELEYSIQALTAATDGGTYCFRVTNAGSATNYAYSAYPEATLGAGGGTLTFVTDGATEAFSNVTPGTLAATSSILTVKTTNTTGFIATVQRIDATGTMSSGAFYIPDKTAWVPGVATTSAGNASASTTQPQTLQFRVRLAGTDTPNYSSAWWGTADTTASALFAGFPSAAQTIVNRSTAAPATTTAYVLYNLNVPVTQRTGSYSGSVTYTVTANP